MKEYDILTKAIEEISDSANLEKKLRIDFTKVIQKPPTVISIMDIEGNECEICTSGNFSLIVGKAKSRKSFFVSTMVVSAIKGDSTLTNMKGSVDCKPVVILFDTEMSEYHSQRMGFAAVKQLPLELRENYMHFKLRELPPKERLNFVEEVLRKHHQYVSLVIIDGIKDLLSQGINDEPESIELTSKLMKWTTEYDLHIACILHQNKNDKNPRGHIGTELMNKAETVLQVEKDPKDNKTSLITPLYTRSLDFEPFGFTLDENLSPINIDFVPHKTAAEEKMERMFGELFELKNYYTYSSLVQTIAEKYKKTESAAKKNISTAQNRKIIIQKDKHYKLNIPEDLEGIPF